MSDTDLEIPIEVEPPKREKKKKVMTPEMLEKLKLAREKAALVKRAARAAKTEKENEIKEKVKKEQLEKMEKKVRNSMIDLSVSLTEGNTEINERARGALPSEKPAIPNKESLEEQVEVIRKPKKPKKKVVVMHDSGSDSDSETQVIYIPRRSNKSSKSKESKETPPPEQPPLAFGHQPRYQLHNFNHNRHFY